MATRLRQVVLDTTDVARASAFWSALLGLVPRDDADAAWANLLTPEGATLLALQRVDALPPSTWPGADVPQQLHLDLTVDDAAELDAVHAQALALGATLLLDRSDDPEERLRVYADLDGHPFCVFVP